MKTTKKINTFFAIGVATLIAGSAWGNNGIQFYSWDNVFDGPNFHAECLGENVTFVWHITGSYHEFVTNSGTYHLIDNWRATAEYTGAITGRTWIAKAVSPFQWNAGPGETNQWVSRAIAKPLTGDGPMFVFENKFKITVTANGDLVVDRPSAQTFSDTIRCLGKKH